MSKDGKSYTEFSNVTFRYIKTRQAQQFDVMYPTEIEMVARNKKEVLHLTFSMVQEPFEHSTRFTNEKFWRGFLICEAPGIVQGYYSDGVQKTPLKGVCKMEPQRQISVLGYNTLRIDVLKPPHGVGITKYVDSHFLEKKLTVGIQLLPRPRCIFKIERIPNTSFLKK